MFLLSSHSVGALTPVIMITAGNVNRGGRGRGSLQEMFMNEEDLVSPSVSKQLKPDVSSQG